MLKSVAEFVDTMHSKGNVVVSKMVVAHIIDRFGIQIHRVTAGRVMKRLGLKWRTIKPVTKSYVAYLLRSVTDYLVGSDRYTKQMQNGD